MSGPEGKKRPAQDLLAAKQQSLAKLLAISIYFKAG